MGAGGGRDVEVLVGEGLSRLEGVAGDCGEDGGERSSLKVVEVFKLPANARE